MLMSSIRIIIKAVLYINNFLSPRRHIILTKFGGKNHAPNTSVMFLIDCPVIRDLYNFKIKLSQNRTLNFKSQINTLRFTTKNTSSLTHPCHVSIGTSNTFCFFFQNLPLHF